MLKESEAETPRGVYSEDCKLVRAPVQIVILLPKTQSITQLTQVQHQFLSKYQLTLLTLTGVSEKL